MRPSDKSFFKTGGAGHRRMHFLPLAAMVAAILLSGTAARAGAPVSLKTIRVPEPANLSKFVKDKGAAIRLGKALFWDMQLGSDGFTACATCHFHAGTDNRTRNQVSPGFLGGDHTFQAGGKNRPNAVLAFENFPFFQVQDIENRFSPVVRNVNDVASAQGVALHIFQSVTEGKDVDSGRILRDGTFSRDGRNVRQVPPRNAPTVINAVFNFTQFWDGRANNFFNGANPFGIMDVGANVWITQGGAVVPLNLTADAVNNPFMLDNASLASQAVGPPLSDVEMSWRGRSWPDVGRKMLSLRPLARQDVHPEDSILAGLRLAGGKGLNTTYAAMVQAAFRDEFWNGAGQVVSGSYTQMQANFSLFFGLALQLYQATLVSDDSPFDRFVEGDAAALSDEAQRGLNLFLSGGAGCTFCHVGSEFTGASVTVARDPLEGGIIEVMTMGDGNLANYDVGFYNIGVRPTAEDVGRGGVASGLLDRDGNPLPLSFARQFALQTNGKLPYPAMGQPGCVNDFVAEPPRICPADLLDVPRITANGSVKTPTLRNVELTGPYFHNGGTATLMQVVDFYVRGGNFREANMADLDPLIHDINGMKNNPQMKADLVSFLLSLTDERVRWERAPFDHPQLFVPDGHAIAIPGNPKITRKLADIVREIPAVGGQGRQAQGMPPLKPFLADNLEGVALRDFHFRH